eukprot:TRINITY_DN12068_c0_g1_i1.p1 TRINITY_DN12068_c0_g1~~TRINITY_DN12068_c0_g1_i1.p1  ORF type:complete len:575 (-),score=151.79 TRINITY_DN12068_c0_g1_i1:133-1857(-)
MQAPYELGVLPNAPVPPPPNPFAPQLPAGEPLGYGWRFMMRPVFGESGSCSPEGEAGVLAAIRSVEEVVAKLRSDIERRFEEQEALLQEATKERSRIIDLVRFGSKSEATAAEARSRSRTSHNEKRGALVVTDVRDSQSGSAFAESERSTEVQLAMLASQSMQTCTSRHKTWGRSEGEDIQYDDEEWVDGESCCRTCFRMYCRMVESDKFDYAMGIIIVLNTVFLGFQEDWRTREKLKGNEFHSNDFFAYSDSAFAIFFSLEVLMRIVASRCSARYWCSLWNWFDLLVVGCTIIEEIVKLLAFGEDTVFGRLSILRTMKVLKLLRALKIIRVVRVFRELRIVLMSIWACTRQLFWTLLLLTIAMYTLVVAVLTELNSSVNPYGDDESGLFRRQYFPNVGRSLLTVYQCTSGGIPWERALTPLAEQIPWFNGLFSCYIAFAVFAFSNTVTGIVVDLAFKAAADDSRNVMLEERGARESMVSNMVQIFRDEAAGRSHINLKMLNAVLAKARVVKYMKKFDIDSRDVLTFFELVCDERRTVAMSEMELFVLSCFRLKGHAKSADLFALNFALQKKFT